METRTAVDEGGRGRTMEADEGDGGGDADGRRKGERTEGGTKKK
jgi:hypothetical protein